MILKLKTYIHYLFFVKLRFWYLRNFNSLIKKQIKNPKKIPIIIINFNQLYYLKQLVCFMQKRGFENIVIIDNHSTYPPLLEYYKSLKNVKIEMMGDNYGHMVFFENKNLQDKYGRGFYVVTDADIVPNDNLPEDFMKTMMDILIDEFCIISKVGFALKIDDIPDNYYFKQKVINWEKKFWINPYVHHYECFFAKIDTTFALYKPNFPNNFNNVDFLQGIRIAQSFTAHHGGWYLDPLNMTQEQKYYQETSNNSSSWLVNKKGNLDPKHSLKYL